MGTCRPLPPRQTWATTPPLVTGERPARRSRLIGATTSRLPRSTATNAPASSTSIGRLPGRAAPARMSAGRVASYHDGSFACPTGGVPHLIVSDFPVLGLVGGQEVIQGLTRSCSAHRQFIHRTQFGHGRGQFYALLCAARAGLADEGKKI